MRFSSSRQYQIVGVVIVLVAGFVLSANAEIPEQISYQGILTDDTGTPLNGEYQIKFNIYGSETSTDSLWSSGYQAVQVDEGLFIYRLGSNVSLPDDLFAGSAIRYLGITVSPDLEIEPRTRFLAVPYAYHALRADTTDWNGLTSVPAGFADGIDDVGEGSKWTVTDSVLHTNNYWGVARGGAGNVLFGDSALTMVNLGVACTTGIEVYDRRYITIAGGLQNKATQNYATVGGGDHNTANGYRATVAGGYYNSASANTTTIGGGNGNTADGNSATVAGGSINSASGDNATIGGGEYNIASGIASTISGGYFNYASGDQATIGGGSHTSASGDQATMCGGDYNAASGTRATVGGGLNNLASGQLATVPGGYGNTASGQYATVPGGYQNTASGAYSFASGHRAKADSAGSYVWADNTNADFSSGAVNGFHVRASGGVYLYTSSNLSTGAYLVSGSGTWSSVCDSTLKRNIREVDYLDIAEKVAALPVSQWSYKTQDESIEHVSPMAQDFYRLFGLGEDDKHLTSLDLAGISLSAIKGLYEMNQEQKARLDQQAEEISNLKEELLRLTLMVEGKAGIEYAK